MSIRIVADENRPSATIEIPLEKPLPDYDLEELDQPTPRDVDGILVSQGFRDLVDDARAALADLLAHPLESSAPLELIQFTGAICPGDDEIYRPGLWIVVSDPQAKSGHPLPAATLARVRQVADQLTKQFQLT